MNRVIVRVCVLAACLAVVLRSAVRAEESSPPWQPGQTFYVPYDPKKPDFQKPIDKIYLPEEDFFDLWERAVPDALPPEKKPLVAYTLGNAAYRGRVEADLAVFDAQFEIETLADGWTEIPLPLSGVALREARVDDRPVTLASGPEGYTLGFEKAGRRTLTLVFAVPVHLASGTGRLSFKPPPVPAARLRLQLPSPGLEAKLGACRGGQRSSIVAGQTVLEAELGEVPEIAVSWSPRAVAGGDAATARVQAGQTLELTLREGYLEVSSRIVFKISRSPVREFALRVDKPLSVYSVTGENLRSWSSRPEEPEVIQAVFNEPVARECALEVRAGAPWVWDGNIGPLPLLAAQGVAGESGTIVVRSAPSLKSEFIPSTSVQRINLPARAPAAGSDASAVAAFEYARTPMTLQARVQALRPALATSDHSLFLIDRERVTARTDTEVEVKAADLFETAAELPSSWKVEALDGENLREWWTVPGEGLQRLHVAFASPVRGKSRLRLSCSIPVADPENLVLRSPRWLDAEERRGDLLLAARQGITLTTRHLDNARPLDLDKAAEHGPSPELPFLPVMAFSFAAANPAVTLALKPVSPSVSVIGVAHVTVESGVLRMRSMLRYEVREAAVDTFRFALPASVGNQIEMKSLEVRQVKSELLGEGDSARRAWGLRLHAPRTGTVEHAFDLEMGLPEAGDIRIPRLEALEVARSEFYLVLANRSEYLIQPQIVHGIQETPPADVPFLPPGLAAGSAVTAYKARTEDWELVFSKQTTKMQELIEASIDWAELKSSVSREGLWLTKLVYHLQNRTEQYLEVEMPEGADIWSVFVRDEPVRPAIVQRPGGVHTLIPLVKTTAGDLSFDVEMVYAQRMPERFQWNGSVSVRAPRVVRIPVTQTYWSLYLPEGFRYYGFGGNMDEIVEEVKLVDKVKAMAREQTQILQSYQYGSEAQKVKARANLAKLQEGLQQSWQKARTDTDQRRTETRQKGQKRYQDEKFQSQLEMNVKELEEIQQTVAQNAVIQTDIERADEAAAGESSRGVGGGGGGIEGKHEAGYAQEGDEESTLQGLARDKMEGRKVETRALSIRVDLPEGGIPYHFKTLKGEARIDFRHTSTRSTHRLGAAGVLLLLVALGVLAGRRLAHPRSDFKD
ncbi:MAG: hypothetical protein HYU36_04650 [Planctomycetes bacterium]|nr:hypothetical protein [Planctomycetota bacterium]